MIIGLTGYAGSGKDTVAEILVRDHGFVRYAFADKLRELVYAMDPDIWCGECGETHALQNIVNEEGWDVAKREFLMVRGILQRVGVWHRDNVSEDFWVNLVAQQIDAHKDEFGEWWRSLLNQGPVVITDVRFSNEARFVREQGGQLWRVQRPGVGPVNGHISEQLDLAADATIWNGGTKASLMLKVNQLVKEEVAA